MGYDSYKVGLLPSVTADPIYPTQSMTALRGVRTALPAFCIFRPNVLMLFLAGEGVGAGEEVASAPFPALAVGVLSPDTLDVALGLPLSSLAFITCTPANTSATRAE